MHDGNKMICRHYYCDVLDFSTGIWWRFDDETVTEFTGLQEILVCLIIIGENK